MSLNVEIKNDPKCVQYGIEGAGGYPPTVLSQVCARHPKYILDPPHHTPTCCLHRPLPSGTSSLSDSGPV